MRFLRKLHLYLGCLFAPMLIFFAVTGSWQLFNWHESARDQTYIAPPAIGAIRARAWRSSWKLAGGSAKAALSK